MTKASRTIAMILVLVMLACSFTSCLSYVYRRSSIPMRVLFAIVDICVLPISLIALVVYLIITEDSTAADSDTYLASADYNKFTDLYFSLQKIYSLPDAELAALKQALDSIPEAERISSMEKISSLSETDLVALVSAFTALPEAEIISSVERIAALSETERVSLLQEFISLSETELASLIEELESLSEDSQYYAAVNLPRDLAYMGYSY